VRTKRTEVTLINMTLHYTNLTRYGFKIKRVVSRDVALFRMGFFLVAPSAALEVKTQKHNNELLAVISYNLLTPNNINVDIKKSNMRFN